MRFIHSIYNGYIPNVMTHNNMIQVFLGRYAVLTDTSLLPVSKKDLLLLIDPED